MERNQAQLDEVHYLQNTLILLHQHMLMDSRSAKYQGDIRTDLKSIFPYYFAEQILNVQQIHRYFKQCFCCNFTIRAVKRRHEVYFPRISNL